MISFIFSFIIFFSSTNVNEAFKDMDSKTELLKAVKSISEDNFKKSLKYMTNALLYEPKNNKNKLILSIAYSSINQYKKAFSLLMGIEDDIAIFYKYYIFYNSGKFNVFKNNYKYLTDKLINAKFKDEEKYIYLASTLYNVDKDLSLLFLKKALQINSNILSINYMLNPIKDIVTLIYSVFDKKFSDSKEYYNSLAKMYNKFRDTTKAKKLLKISIEKYKNNQRAKKILAHSYIIEKKYKKAFDILNKVKENFLLEENTYLYYIEIYENIMKEKEKELLDICKKAEFYVMDSTGIKLCVAKMSYKLGKYDETYKKLQYILKKNINDPDANLLMVKVLKVILEEIDRQAYEGVITIKRANALKKEYTQKQIIDYIGRALEKRPYDFNIMKLFYKEYLKIDVSNIDELKKLNITNTQLSYLVEEKENYDRITLQEENNIKFNKLFNEYLINKDEKMIKEMKYLGIASSIISYIDYLNDKNDKKLLTFLDQYSKKYIKLLKKPYFMNQKLYSKKFEDGKVLEFTKIFNFIVPEYF